MTAKPTLYIRIFVAVLCILLTSLPLVAQSGNKTIRVHGTCIDRCRRMSNELVRILFIKEQAHLDEAHCLYTFALNAESAYRLGTSQIVVACINGVSLDDYFGVTDIELEVIPLEGTNIYYCKKPVEVEGNPNFMYGMDFLFRDHTNMSKKFIEFFWDNPDKPQFVPNFVFSAPLFPTYIPQLIKALSSDLMIHPEGKTRESLEHQIPLRTLAIRHLIPVRRLAVGAPKDYDAEDWQRWYDELPQQQIKFDTADIPVIEYVSPAIIDTKSYYHLQDNTTGTIYQCHDTLYSHALDVNNNFSELTEPIDYKNIQWRRRSSDAVVAKLFPASDSVESYPCFLPLSTQYSLVAVMRNEGYQQKLYVYKVDNTTHKVSRGGSIYVYLPLDDDSHYMRIRGMFRTNNNTCIIVGVENTYKWLIVSDNTLV